MPSITITLTESAYKTLKNRAKKNMLDLKEQIEDIIRRSMLSYKKTSPATPKIDDKLVSIFSREKKGRKKCKKRR